MRWHDLRMARAACALSVALACAGAALADLPPPSAMGRSALAAERTVGTPAAADPTGPLPAETLAPAPQNRYLYGPREGGDTCADALPIDALPFEDYGYTCDNVNDYDAVCPYGGSTAKDVVYSFTPAVNYNVTISLCNDGTDYDTKLYIYQDACPGTRIACNEDACNSPQFPSGYISRLTNVELPAGHTYYIIVDGYGTNCGNYHITMTGVAQCAVCPAGGTSEGEPVCYTNYEDHYNGGCNWTPYVFQPITCGETICGESGWFAYGTNLYRDTDWYEITLTEAVELTWAIEARFRARGFIIDGTNGCDGTILATGASDYCGTATMRAEVGPGTYWLWAGPRTSDPTEVCGSDYVATLTCSATPNCVPDDIVTAPGTWSGNTFNAGSKCQALPSEDRVYEVNLPYSSTWRVHLETDFPTYMLVGSSCCAYDLGDDYSNVVLYDTNGTIWVAVEGQISTLYGNYTLTITDIAGELECPPGGIAEGEPECYDDYDDTYNVGCEGTPPVFTPIAPGDTICGAYGTFALNGYATRDTDWYEVTLTEYTSINWTLIGEAATSGYILAPGPNGCADYTVLAYADGNPHDEFTVQAYVPPGTYWLWAGTYAFSGVPCGKNYIAHLECEPWLCTPEFTATAPGTWTGVNCGGGNDCHLWGSEEHMYEVTLPYVADWRISLCGSSYHTRLFVGTTCCAADLGTNMNHCGTQSELDVLNRDGTIYVTIEGYGSSDCGWYELAIGERPPMEPCPAGAMLEDEQDCAPNYDDVYNGGCDIPTPVFQPINCGETMCGASGVFPFLEFTYRDTDWFEVWLDDTSTLTWEIMADFAPGVIILDPGSGDCSDVSPLVIRAGSSHVWVAATVNCLPPGRYWLWVAPRYFEGVPCGSDWIGVVTCEPCPGACCLPEAPYCAEMTTAQCAAAGGLFAGTGTTCDFAADCNANGVPDTCDLAFCDGSPWCSDCNGNGQLDYCDVPAPAGNCTGACSMDCQPDGVPDECQLYPDGPTVVWDNGPFITHPPPTGCNGESVSALQTALGLNAYGLNAYVGANHIADDFRLSSFCQLQTLTLYGYQTNYAPPTVTEAFVRIWDGPPNAGGTILFGSMSANRLISATVTGAWRASDQNLESCSRGLCTCVLDLAGLNLPAGTYWLEVALNGVEGTGPWVPPVTVLGQLGKTGANGLMYSVSSGFWDPLVDSGAAQAPQDLPFLLTGFGYPPPGDCNANNIIDDCDLMAGTSHDVNGNGVPDECDGIVPGDLNCDNAVDFRDINPFVLALTNPAVYATLYPDCPVWNGDINQDGQVGFGDINPFVTLLSSPP